MVEHTTPVQTYRLRPAIGIRVVGIGCLWLAGAVGLEAVLRTFDGLDGTVAGAVLGVLRWICVAAFVVGLVFGLVTVLGVRARLVLDADGFRNHTARRGQVRTAKWTDVRDVRRVPEGLLIALSDGRVSRVGTGLLDSTPADIEDAVRLRLDAAHGYQSR